MQLSLSGSFLFIYCYNLGVKVHNKCTVLHWEAGFPRSNLDRFRWKAVPSQLGQLPAAAMTVSPFP